MSGDADVIVLGEGLGGLLAARALRKEGLERVLLLEGAPAADGAADASVLFVGADDAELRDIVDDLGVDLAATHTEGAKILDAAGVTSIYEDGAPRGIPARALRDIAAARRAVDAHAAKVDPEAPQLCAAADRYDSVSVQDFLSHELRTPVGAAVLDTIAQQVLGSTAKSASLLGFLHAVRSRGGLAKAIGLKGGAMQDRAAIERLREAVLRELEGAKDFRLRRLSGHGAASIRLLAGGELGGADLAATAGASGCGVEVSGEAAGGRAFTFRAKFCVVAMDAVDFHSRRVSFAPRISSARLELMRRSFRGAATRILVSYARPFWRAAGFSGEVLADAGAGPLSRVIDLCSGGDAALLCLVQGAAAGMLADMADEERREAVLRQLERYFGSEALDAAAYEEAEWRGGAVFPTGLLSDVGQARRKPCLGGRVHWAGSDAADRGAGTWNGAVVAAATAAREVRRLAAGERIGDPCPRSWLTRASLEQREKQPEEVGLSTERRRRILLGGSVLGMVVGVAIIGYALFYLLYDVFGGAGGSQVTINGQTYRVEETCDGTGRDSDYYS